MSRTIPYLNRLSQTIPYLNTLSRTLSYYITVGSQSIRAPESSANQHRVLRHPRALGQGRRTLSALGSSRLAITYLNTRGLLPPTSSTHSSTTDICDKCLCLLVFGLGWNWVELNLFLLIFPKISVNGWQDQSSAFRKSGPFDLQLYECRLDSMMFERSSTGLLSTLEILPLGLLQKLVTCGWAATIKKR